MLEYFLPVSIVFCWQSGYLKLFMIPIECRHETSVPVCSLGIRKAGHARKINEEHERFADSN